MKLKRPKTYTIAEKLKQIDFKAFDAEKKLLYIFYKYQSYHNKITLAKCLSIYARIFKHKKNCNPLNFKFLEDIVAAAKPMLTEFSEYALAKSIWVLAVLQYCEQDFISSWVACATPRLHRFNPRNLAISIWALAMLDYKDENFISEWVKCFFIWVNDANARNILFDSVNLNQIYSAFLYFDLFPDKLSMLEKQFSLLIVAKQKTTVSSFDMAMEKTLTEAGILFKKQVFVCGYVVDFIVHENIIIECDGEKYHPFIKKMKEKILQKQGYIILHIEDREFDAAKDKKQFVMDLIMSVEQKQKTL